MDFVCDIDQYINGFHPFILDVKETIDKNVKSIYDGIDAMNEGWGGQEYEDFKEKAYNYKVYLEALKTVYSIYDTMIVKQIVLGGWSEFQKSVKAAITKIGE